MQNFLKNLLKILALTMLAVLIIFTGLWLAVPFNANDLNKILNIDGSPALYDNQGRLFHLRLSPDSEWQVPIKLEEMGKWLPLVAVGVEDGRFYSHFGVDIIAIARALYQNLIYNRVASGASTITSQLVRLAVSEREGRPRSIPTKIREFIMAMKLEHELSKPEILENYLNRAPFGGNIRGVQAASLIYFNKSASQISTGEACLLIGMLKSPTLYRPDLNYQAAKTRRDAIIKLMLSKKIFTHDEAARALLEELPRKRTQPPFKAYHFAELAFNRYNSKNLYTSLDLNAQVKLEAILTQAARSFPANITLAAGIADNKTGKLIAWVGNARFNLNNINSRAAWVDCGLGLRSPGSTLKPFAYLEAVEQGILTGSTLLADTQTAFSGRAPRNFDLSYRGAVSARVALAESLNAPAVRVLRRAGQEKVLSLIKDFGYKHFNNNAKYYGDSLILGGCEVTLYEELEAFTALASLGKFRPLSLLKDEEVIGSRVASQEACWMICDILNHKGALSLFSRGTLGQKWRIALKTGTSYGLRDAWTAAWTPDYTAVVWAGSPDGTAWPGLVGAKAAAPVAVKILRIISPKSGWYDKPDKVVSRRVCSLSGEPPTAACISTRAEWSIDGVTHTVPCKLHTLKQGEKVLIMPHELEQAKNIKIKRIYRKSPLNIVAPVDGSSYIFAPFDLERRIAFRSEGAAGQVYWYMDGEYLGSAAASANFFHGVTDGEHIIGVTDQDGRSASINISVMTPGKRRKNSELILK
ncbi:MAG: penicillin-binding protein 1C [Synergistaceae bacterium]|nr:penicillin-binding protein 1C [Synergistaceae bacterium]